jgi:hypothetical protein
VTLHAEATVLPLPSQTAEEVAEMAREIERKLQPHH